MPRDKDRDREITQFLQKLGEDEQAYALQILQKTRIDAFFGGFTDDERECALDVLRRSADKPRPGKDGPVRPAPARPPVLLIAAVVAVAVATAIFAIVGATP